METKPNINQPKDLKSLIREDPHWIIRFGSSMMVVLVLGLLIISTQLMMVKTEKLPLDFPLTTETGEGFVSASFELPESSDLQQGDSLDLSIFNQGREAYYPSKVQKISEGKVWIELPNSIQFSDQSQVNLACNPRGFAHISAGSISVFQKWYASLFHSLKSK